MIVWLASYPRSGNTLLRTIFKKTMGIGSYSDEQLLPNVGFTESALDEFGHLPLTKSWDSFYETASASSKTYLVKTHLPPRDKQSVIYIVRDGRQSLISYYKYHQKFFPEYTGKLIDLVLGADYYGSWSDHYANWNCGTRKRLLLRYEDIVDISPDALQSLAQFIDHQGEIFPWENPFEHLQRENPDFFKAGILKWQNASEWSDFINALFFLLHGDLMKTLDYESPEKVDEALTSLSPEMIELVEIVKAILKQKTNLENTCKERLLVIEALDVEIKKLIRPIINKNSMAWRFFHRFFT